MSVEDAIEAFSIGNYQSALTQFTKSIETTKTNDLEAVVSLHDMRAATYERLNQHQDALKDAHAIIKMAPKNPRGYLRMGKILRILGDQDSLNSAHSIYRIGIKRCPHGEPLTAVLSQQLEALQKSFNAKNPFFQLDGGTIERVYNHLKTSNIDLWRFSRVSRDALATGRNLIEHLEINSGKTLPNIASLTALLSKSRKINSITCNGNKALNLFSKVKVSINLTQLQLINIDDGVDLISVTSGLAVIVGNLSRLDLEDCSRVDHLLVFLLSAARSLEFLRLQRINETCGTFLWKCSNHTLCLKNLRQFSMRQCESFKTDYLMSFLQKHTSQLTHLTIPHSRNDEFCIDPKRLKSLECSMKEFMKVDILNPNFNWQLRNLRIYGRKGETNTWSPSVFVDILQRLQHLQHLVLNNLVFIEETPREDPVVFPSWSGCMPQLKSVCFRDSNLFLFIPGPLSQALRVYINDTAYPMQLPQIHGYIDVLAWRSLGNAPTISRSEYHRLLSMIDEGKVRKVLAISNLDCCIPPEKFLALRNTYPLLNIITNDTMIQQTFFNDSLI